MEDGDAYTRLFIQRNLRDNYKTSDFYLDKGKYAVKLKSGREIKGFEPISGGGKFSEFTVRRLANEIAKDTGEKSTEVMRKLTLEPRYAVTAKRILREEESKKSEMSLEDRLRKLLDLAIIGLSAGLVIFIAVQRGILTGFVVGGISKSFVNGGILICVIGIVGLLLYKFKKRN